MNKQDNTSPLLALAERARKVSILVDILDASQAAYGALETGASGALRREMAVRLAELLRRTSPAEALAFLDKEGFGDGEAGAAWLPNDIITIKIHALLDLMRADDARSLARWLKAPSGGKGEEVALVKARLAYLVERAGALKEIAAAIDQGTAAEVRAEALLLRAKWLMEMGDIRGAVRDLDALGWLVAEHGAVGTGMMLVVFQRVAETMLASLGDAGVGVGEVAEGLERKLMEGIDCDPLSLGPVPGVLHALTVRYSRDTQGTWGKHVLMLAGLFESAGQFQKCYTILFYACALSVRFFGENSDGELRRHLAWLRERLGYERFGELESHENRRLDALSRLARRPPAPPSEDNTP